MSYSRYRHTWLQEHGLAVSIMVLGEWVDSRNLEVFSNLNYSLIL